MEAWRDAAPHLRAVASVPLGEAAREDELFDDVQDHGAQRPPVHRRLHDGCDTCGRLLESGPLSSSSHHGTTPMNVSRNSLAIVGAGPFGLEAALCGLERGLDVHVFERGEVGAHPVAWGHVRMFTPWRMNIGPTSVAQLERTGWTRPAAESCPTGAELARRYLEPLAGVPALAKGVHTHAQLVHISRRGRLKGDMEGRRDHPFRLMVRDAGGRESYLHAYAVIDASGVYGQPNWAGDGGIPARQELYLAPQMTYHLDDVLGVRRSRYAGKRTLVIGA